MKDKLSVCIIGTCTNDAGIRCKFQFDFKGQTYKSCTDDGAYSTPWCYDVRGNDNWDYCSKCMSKYS